MELSRFSSNNAIKILECIANTDKSTLPNDNLSSDEPNDSCQNNIINTINNQQHLLSELETQEIIQKYNRGASTYQLAEEYSCCRSAISNALKRNGIEPTNEISKRKAIPELVMQMYSEYIKPADIAKALGVNVVSIRKILHENNVPLRHARSYDGR